ncbi:pilus assembly protein PilP [Candidatus Pelagibacter sp.]|jgi:hypothetical protein|nr:pilus assembly protein PilP [Candidatus Pelagibacter bacterium]MDB3886402.1 pilus assembly protein PilP [Candidatus Pelagibacter sp.]MDC0895499.1 pilus assembly protein PilP [Candidatus Pelagibacter sp.]MDC0901121.1 pilus assembly protein PilP [Candidatus Pelagibacter sp.]MDC1069617.1 pilus assembly protein PilP [Candidatus Pelagibacter sp.]
MNFFKIIIISVFFMLLSKVSMADSHDNKQDIIEKAKEINKKIKEKQANSQSNISSEINDEEPLPLNDPFAGDSSLTGGNTILSSNPEEAQNEMSLYKFKLVGIMTSENDDGFVSLINSSGNIITLAKFEELSPGVKLVGLNNREAVFEKNENSLLVINFNNKITERTK